MTCPECSDPVEDKYVGMKKVGETGKVVMYDDGEVAGSHPEILYQCPECKTVIIQ